MTGQYRCYLRAGHAGDCFGQDEMNLGPRAPAAQPPQPGERHDLNEYTYCVRCKRFDPSDAMPCVPPAAREDYRECLTRAHRESGAMEQRLQTALTLLDRYRDLARAADEMLECATGFGPSRSGKLVEVEYEAARAAVAELERKP